jgi:hypothetical protein
MKLKMNRTYANSDSPEVEFFTGTEVENTLAAGKQTLFVVGVQPVETIRKWLAVSPGRGNRAAPIEHIFFGANHSFNIETAKDAADWEIMVNPFINSDYLVTVDFDISQVDYVLETGWCEANNFIPLISAKIPYAEQLGYNAVLKIDDVDFDRSNPGVWCHHLRSLQSPATFTPWHAYRKDHVL